MSGNEMHAALDLFRHVQTHVGKIAGRQADRFHCVEQAEKTDVQRSGLTVKCGFAWPAGTPSFISHWLSSRFTNARASVAPREKPNTAMSIRLTLWLYLRLFNELLLSRG